MMIMTKITRNLICIYKYMWVHLNIFIFSSGNKVISAAIYINSGELIGKYRPLCSSKCLKSLLIAL